MQNKDGYLIGNNGNKSSKRLLGVIMISLAIAYGLGVGIGSVFSVIKSPDTCLTILQYFLMGGCSLLGIGVFEGKMK